MRKIDKLVLVGPIYPYKGGISHYTGMMYNALNDRFDVTMVSYKMQYPKLLYRKEQRDYGNDRFKIADTKYWINTVNPFNWIFSARKIRKEKPDLVLFQWWHPYFAPCYWVMEKMLKRKTKIMFLCHNVFPHERFPMDRFLTKRVLNNGNYFIVQSSMDYNDLKSIKPDSIAKQTVHPTYNAFKIKDMSKEEARLELNIKNDEKVLLFFGFIREYKGLKHLINAMPEIKKQLSNVKLLVVGDFDSEADKEKYLKQIRDRQVEDVVNIYDGYIPDKEVEKFFASSDLVVLPYESATQSGIVQIAYGFQKPCIVTNVGGLPEVVVDGKTGYVVEPQNYEELAKAVIEYFNEDKEEEFSINVKGEEYKYSWDRLVEVVEELTEKDIE